MGKRGQLSGGPGHPPHPQPGAVADRGLRAPGQAGGSHLHHRGNDTAGTQQPLRIAGPAQGRGHGRGGPGDGTAAYQPSGRPQVLPDQRRRAADGAHRQGPGRRTPGAGAGRAGIQSGLPQPAADPGRHLLSHRRGHDLRLQHPLSGPRPAAGGPGPAAFPRRRLPLRPHGRGGDRGPHRAGLRRESGHRRDRNAGTHTQGRDTPFPQLRGGGRHRPGRRPPLHRGHRRHRP